MKISNVNIYGLENAILTSRYPMVADTEEFWNNMNDDVKEKAKKVATKLAQSGGAEGHDQFLTGITVTFDMTCSIQLWQEAERYRFLYFVSSTSKMHRLHQMNIDKCCNEYVDNRIKDIVNDKQDKYLEALELQKEGKMDADEVKKCFYELVYNVPSGFEYTAGMITNYRQLKTIYSQRKQHRLQEWRDFCKWVESLPMSELITGN